MYYTHLRTNCCLNVSFCVKVGSPTSGANVCWHTPWDSSLNGPLPKIFYKLILCRTKLIITTQTLNSTFRRIVIIFSFGLTNMCSQRIFYHNHSVKFLSEFLSRMCIRKCFKIGNFNPILFSYILKTNRNILKQISFS